MFGLGDYLYYPELDGVVFADYAFGSYPYKAQYIVDLANRLVFQALANLQECAGICKIELLATSIFSTVAFPVQYPKILSRSPGTH